MQQDHVWGKWHHLSAGDFPRADGIPICGVYGVFAAQPRLALVTNTFRNCAGDMFHFGLVFFLAFALFALAGQLCFGRDFDAFASYGESWNMMFRLGMLGPNWRDLQSVQV